MAVKNKALKVGKKAQRKTAPYVNRLLTDEDLRRMLLHSYHASSRAIGRIRDDKRSSKSIFNDKKLKDDVEDAITSLREAAQSLQLIEKKKSPFSIGRLILITIVGAILAFAFSEELRKRVLDMLFGAEEEFEYTSPTVAGEANSAGKPSGTNDGSVAPKADGKKSDGSTGKSINGNGGSTKKS